MDLIDSNFGDFNTGFIQYLLQAKNVNAHCAEEVILTRSAAYTECPGCIEKMSIAVSVEKATDPTTTTTSAVNSGDSAEVAALKTNCEADSQTYWSSN